MHTQFARTSALVLTLTGISACDPDDLETRSFEAEDPGEDEAAGGLEHGPALGLRDELPEPAEGTYFAGQGPYHGGTGGDQWVTGCGEGAVALGIYGRAGSEIDQLGLVCSKIGAGGLMGPEYYSSPIGGGGGSPFNITCPGGYAVAALSGRSATRIDRLSLMCRHIHYGWWYFSGYAGGNGGNEWNDGPYANVYVSQLIVRAGSRVDAVQSILSYLYW